MGRGAKPGRSRLQLKRNWAKLPEKLFIRSTTDRLSPGWTAPSPFTVCLEEIGEGAGRISELVKALKSYSYLDQAPVQMVNVHEGLDSTLVILAK